MCDGSGDKTGGTGQGGSGTLIRPSSSAAAIFGWRDPAGSTGKKTYFKFHLVIEDIKKKKVVDVAKKLQICYKHVSCNKFVVFS